MKKIKCIIKRPDEEYGHVTNISPRLENLQKTVEGYIETVPLSVERSFYAMRKASSEASRIICPMKRIILLGPSLSWVPRAMSSTISR